MNIEASGSHEESVPRNLEVNRNELFSVLKNKQFCKLSSIKCNQLLLQYILDKFNISEISEQNTKQIQLVTKVFVTKVFTKWRSCNYMPERFYNKHTKWLEGDLMIKLPSQIPASASTNLHSATIRPYSPEEALGLIVDLGLAKEDYETIRLSAKDKGADIYPSYEEIEKIMRVLPRK